METLERPLWQLLLAEPSNLTCEECFTVMEYYFETLGDDRDALFPIVEKYLGNCPVCVMEQHLALYREMVSVEDEHGVPYRES